MITSCPNCVTPDCPEVETSKERLRKGLKSSEVHLKTPSESHICFTVTQNTCYFTRCSRPAVSIEQTPRPRGPRELRPNLNTASRQRAAPLEYLGTAHGRLSSICGSWGRKNDYFVLFRLLVGTFIPVFVPEKA